MGNFQRARLLWQQGDVHGAIKLYRRIVNQLEDTAELKRDIATYMITYLYILEAKKMHSEMAILGVDLNSAYHDYYYKAALCYRQVKTLGFDPAILDLPEIQASDYEAMQDAYQQCSYINRCAAEFFPQAWNFDCLNYFRRSIQSLLHTFGSRGTRLAHR